MAEKILFAAESDGQYTPFSEFVASTTNHASEAISTPPMGREGRRRAGGLHLSHVQWVGWGWVVGGFHAQRWTRRWRREVSGAEIIRRIEPCQGKVFVLAWHLCGRILPRSQWRMCLVLVLTCVAVFGSTTSNHSSTGGKVAHRMRTFIEANLRFVAFWIGRNPSTP